MTAVAFGVALLWNRRCDDRGRGVGGAAVAAAEQGAGMSDLRKDIEAAVAELLTWPLSKSEQATAITDEVMALLDGRIDDA